jgi:subtilisin family serine protease
MNMRVMLSFFLTAVCFAASVRDNPPSRRWALILDAPASVTLSSSARMAADSTAAARIEAEQRSLRAALAERKIPVTGSVQTLMNAVFVEAGPERAAELRSLPGVRLAVPMRRLRRHLDAAIDLVNARTAWNAVGGMQNAGAGVKIGIIDTGIDQDHPAFVDGSLTPPAGFPKCSGDDCKYTNKKVIVARSYVSMLTSSSNPNGPGRTTSRRATGVGMAPRWPWWPRAITRAARWRALWVWLPRRSWAITKSPARQA